MEIQTLKLAMPHQAHHVKKTKTKPPKKYKIKAKTDINN